MLVCRSERGKNKKKVKFVTRPALFKHPNRTDDGREEEKEKHETIRSKLKCEQLKKEIK